MPSPLPHPTLPVIVASLGRTEGGIVMDAGQRAEVNALARL